MTDPEHALEQARASAASMRASGSYGEDELPPGADELQGRAGVDELLEWALIEPDVTEVRSTRRLGAPVTLLKRGLLRMLAQYHAQLLADQTRFNVHVLGHIRRLENRIEELEGQLLARDERARSADEPRR
jgi:hypothetical protein